MTRHGWLGDFFGLERLREAGVTHGPGAMGGHLPPVLTSNWNRVVRAIRELNQWFGSYAGEYAGESMEVPDSPPINLKHEMRDDYVGDGVRPFPEYYIAGCVVWVLPAADLHVIDTRHPVSAIGSSPGNSNERKLIIGSMALVVYKP